MMEKPQPVAVLRRIQIDEMLLLPPQPGKRLLEPLRSLSAREKIPFNILEDHEIVNSPEIHRHEGDLWHCLQGEAVFTYGGELFGMRILERSDGSRDDREIQGSGIKDGSEVTLYPGDWLWIPPGQPHAHRTKSTTRLVIIKIPALEPIPLASISGWKSLIRESRL